MISDGNKNFEINTSTEAQSETKRISKQDGPDQVKASGCSREMACMIQQRLTDLETFLENQFLFLSEEQSILVKKKVADEWTDYLRRKDAIV